MKAGFDHVHDYPRRMELAIKRLKENKSVSLHNRFKILRFMDYLETRGVSPPRTIRYLVELTRLASMLPLDFEKATRDDIEKVILEHGRLGVSENTKAYVKQDGQRTVNVRVLTIRAQRYLPKIKEDVDLLQEVLETYERNKTK